MDLLGNLLLGIDHVGVCVSDMDEAGTLWSCLLGVPLVDREDVAAQKTAAGFLRMPVAQGQAPQATVELVCPMPGNAGLETFLDGLDLSDDLAGTPEYKRSVLRKRLRGAVQGTQ